MLDSSRVTAENGIPPIDAFTRNLATSVVLNLDTLPRVGLHYIAHQTALFILAKATKLPEIWASRSEMTNDMLELKYAVQLAGCACHKLLKDGIEDQFRLVPRLANETSPLLGVTKDPNIYIACFSQEDLLSQADRNFDLGSA